MPLESRRIFRTAGLLQGGTHSLCPLSYCTAPTAFIIQADQVWGEVLTGAVSQKREVSVEVSCCFTALQVCLNAGHFGPLLADV